MKKYKLKKDFPGSKIGDVWIKADSGFMSPEDRETIKMHEHLFKPFNDWFEDYEESKDYCYIEPNGIVARIDEWDCCTENDRKVMKSIGNYFETREEAEKAVEKLKAWKRLKDKGFRFERWSVGGEYGNTITFSDYIEYNDETRADLDLLFGGKDESNQ